MQGTFPTQRSIAEGEGSIELDEERRLCYVAMTRAKTYLVMTWRREVQTFFGQGFRFTHPDRSRFLDRLVSKKGKKGLKKKSKSSNSKSIEKRILADSRRDFHTSARRSKNVNIDDFHKRKVKLPTKKRRATKMDMSRTKSDLPPMSIDSSSFFPVGSVVRHPIHGEGKVITPKPMSNGGKMMVSVNFKSGMQVDFPVEKAGLTIQH